MYAPPVIIFPQKKIDADLDRDAPESSFSLISDTGYKNIDISLNLLNRFSSHVKPCEISRFIKILHNHISHCNLDAVIFRRNSFITLLTVPLAIICIIIQNTFFFFV